MKNAKKILAIILSFVMIATSVCNMWAFDSYADSGSDITWTYDENTKTLTVSGGKIPDYAIDSSPYSAIKGDVEKLVVDEGVTAIGDQAFNGMVSVKEFILPDSLTEVGMYLAADMNISNLYIPKNVISLDFGATQNCENLTEITVSPENKHYYSDSNCIIYNHVESEDKSIIAGCKSSVIPSYVTDICFLAFAYLDGIERFDIPDSVKSIWYDAFEGCYIKNLSIGSNAIEVDNEAFRLSRFDYITVSSGNNAIKMRSHCLIKDGVVITYEYCGADAEPIDIVVPEGVTTVSEAPNNHYNVETLTLPSTFNLIDNFFWIQNISRLNIKANTAPSIVDADSLYDCDFPNGIHVYKNSKGYDKSPWTDYEILYDLDEENPEPEPEPEPEKDPELTLEDLYFSFTNSRSAMGYSNGYKIPLSAYQVFFSDAQARLLYNNAGSWGGSCFGMSTLPCTLVHTEDSGIGCKDFGLDKTKVRDLKVLDKSSILGQGSSLRDLIEAMHVSQFHSDYQEIINRGGRYLTEEQTSLLNDLKNHKTDCIVTCVSRYYGNGYVGHALVAYGIEFVSDKEDHLNIYDPNYSSIPRYITLYKDSGGEYIGWFYSVNDSYLMGSDYSDSELVLIDYDTVSRLWNNRNKPNLNMVSVDRNIAKADIINENGDVIATIDRGDVISYDDSVIPIVDMSIDSSFADSLFYINEAGVYTIDVERESELDLQIAGESYSTAISAETGDVESSIEIVIGDDSADSVSFDKAISSYSITYYKDGKVIKTDSSDEQKGNDSLVDKTSGNKSDVIDGSNNTSSKSESNSTDNNTMNKSSSKKQTLKKYTNEWVNGKWYDMDGNQSYAGVLVWKCNSSGWWVEDTKGWYPTNTWQKIDGKWYYFNQDGYMAENEWRDGCWLNQSGAWEYTGISSWNKDNKGWYYKDSTGWYATSSWQKINGRWYYFDSSGYMVTNTKIEGYWIGANGVCE